MEDHFETRTVNISNPDPVFPMMYEEFVPFGWEQIGVTTVGNSEYAVLERDIKMPNYRRIASLDEEYFRIRGMKMYHTRMSLSTLLILTIFFVVPGIIYLGYRIYRYRSVNKYNDNIQKKMNELADEARSLLETKKTDTE